MSGVDFLDSGTVRDAPGHPDQGVARIGLCGLCRTIAMKNPLHRQLADLSLVSVAVTALVKHERCVIR